MNHLLVIEYDPATGQTRWALQGSIPYPCLIDAIEVVKFQLMSRRFPPPGQNGQTPRVVLPDGSLPPPA